jgi:transposase
LGPGVLPKSPIGEAVTYATDQWPTLGVYLSDGRLPIDNGPAEQAIRSIAVRRRNWLHVAGDAGLHPAAVLLSITASVKRRGINPRVFLRHVRPDRAAGLPHGANLTDLLPGVWVRSLSRAPTVLD